MRMRRSLRVLTWYAKWELPSAAFWTWFAVVVAGLATGQAQLRLLWIWFLPTVVIVWQALRGRGEIRRTPARHAALELAILAIHAHFVFPLDIAMLLLSMLRRLKAIPRVVRRTAGATIFAWPGLPEALYILTVALGWSLMVCFREPPLLTFGLASGLAVFHLWLFRALRWVYRPETAVKQILTQLVVLSSMTFVLGVSFRVIGSSSDLSREALRLRRNLLGSSASTARGTFMKWGDELVRRAELLARAQWVPVNLGQLATTLVLLWVTLTAGLVLFYASAHFVMSRAGFPSIVLDPPLAGFAGHILSSLAILVPAPLAPVAAKTSLGVGLVLLEAIDGVLMFVLFLSLAMGSLHRDSTESLASLQEMRLDWQNKLGEMISKLRSHLEEQKESGSSD